ncbi:polyphenol oxidase family protein [Geovibrio thiophilus]|uniref:polyphenol oxidase family protein n=1 Tax=Geovibrio thiophilus TaxID=139438 RepID=UPI0013E2C412|nr:polyphenol oxidase family protein [Geovibrio thiophilus]
MLVAKDGAEYICAVDDSDILQITSTNRGGYSEGIYTSFNAALHVGDDCFKVLKNLEKLKTAWGISRLVTLTQVHGNVIREVTAENIADVMFSDGDGLFTRERGIALGILTADCWNVHLIGRGCLASLHCGWKSAAAGIVENALSMFEEAGDRVTRAVVGPGISTANFEVGSEVADIFTSAGHGESVESICGRMCFSIGGSVERTLRNAGVPEITRVTDCTYSSDYLFSYRRDSGRTGRMISILMRK